jgi:hypothetical protein
MSGVWSERSEPARAAGERGVERARPSGRERGSMTGLAGPGVLVAHGLLAASAPGWDVRIGRRGADPGETAHTVLHAATFALPAERADYGDGAVERMGPGDVFVALVEFAPSALGTALFAAQGWPPPLTGADFSRSSVQRPLVGHAGVQRWFSEGGRPWCLYVVIGSWDNRAVLAGRANALLAGLEIGL